MFFNKEFSNGLNPEGFSDIIVEPLTNQLTFADEHFIVTQVGNLNKKILASDKQKEEELDDHEEGSGRIDFRVYEKLLNLTTNRVETPSGRQDYNTIGILKIFNLIRIVFKTFFFFWNERFSKVCRESNTSCCWSR